MLFMISTVILAFIVSFTLRTVFVLFQKKNGIKKLPVTAKIKTMCVLGSGGHTAEMLRLLSTIKDHYDPRIYVIAEHDQMSLDKVVKLEKSCKYSNMTIELIPRSREVHQSWILSVKTTLFAILYSMPIFYHHKPDLILCNGPGTCVPICLIGLLMQILGFKSAIVYVESICRVKSMSLTGKILYYIADEVYIQWPSLKQKYPKSKYIGMIF